MVDFDPDKMRARFHQLKAKRDGIREKADPIRAERDKLVQDTGKKIAAANARVQKAEKGLFEIDQEMAVLVRALKGKMGDPDEADNG